MHTLGLLAISSPRFTVHLDYSPTYTIGTLSSQCNTIMRSPRPVLSVYSKNISTTTYSTYDIGIYSLFFVPSLYYLSENASQLVPLIDDVSCHVNSWCIWAGAIKFSQVFTMAFGGRWPLGDAGLASNSPCAQCTPCVGLAHASVANSVGVKSDSNSYLVSYIPSYIRSKASACDSGRHFLGS
jgi:hypothetical protein